MTESCIFRKSPKFRRSEILQWDESPVPMNSDLYRPVSHRGAAGNIRLHRECQGLSSWALVGDGSRRGYELGSGWDCAMEISLADGYQRWTRQRAIGDSILQTWTTIKTPGTGRTLVYTGSFQMSPGRIQGGSIQTGQLDILRFEHGLSISLENSEIGARREWRLDQSSQRKVRICDVHDLDASRPCIIASADNPVSLRKTIRWLVLELTGLIVADQFLAWDASSGIDIDRPAAQPLLAVAMLG